MGEVAAGRVGIVDVQRQRRRVFRHAVPLQRRTDVLPGARVLRRNRLVAAEGRAGQRDLAGAARAAGDEDERERECEASHSYNPAMPTFFEALNELMAADVPLV